MLALDYWPNAVRYAVRYAALILNHVFLHGKEEVPAVLTGKCKINFFISSYGLDVKCCFTFLKNLSGRNLNLFLYLVSSSV